MPAQGTSWFTKLTQAPQLAPFRIRDFRLLWTGAFFSFIGSWVQTVAQGWLVYEITKSEQMLAMVAFFGMLPMSVLGPFAGAITDVLDKRKVLIAAQTIYGVNALFLAAAIHFNFLRLEFILAVAVLNGLTSTVEIPTRQSLVSRVVPLEHISAAVPMQAMTFNMARIMGSALGGLLLGLFGAEAGYLLNGLSYIALIFAVIGIRSDLSGVPREIQPMRDLLMEGMRYTWRDKRLKMLFLMESTVSIFGLAYIPLLPAFAKDVLKLNKFGLSNLYTSIGIGALLGLVTLITYSNRPIKALVVKTAMTCMGIGLILISIVRSPWLAYPLASLIGASTVMQFNTTNTLFQIIAPEALKGRVLAMHMWALNGLSPFALPVFGALAQSYSVDLAMRIGGILVLAGAALGWLFRSRLEGVDQTTLVVKKT